MFAAALVGFLLFYLQERRVPQPLIDFSLFRKIDFLAGNITGLLLSASMMGVFFMIPIFLQTVLGFSALKAGLVMSPMSVVIIFAAPWQACCRTGSAASGSSPSACCCSPSASRGWFTDAINTTFIVGVAFALGGAFCALLLRGQPQRTPRQTIPAEAQGEALPAVTGSAPVVTPDHT